MMKIREFSAENTFNQICEDMRKLLQKTGANGFVLGLSGGIDSALVARIIKEVSPMNSAALILPIKSSKKDLEDAQTCAKSIGIKTETIDLENEHGLILGKLKESSGFNEEKLRITSANLMARLRMSTIYAYANLHGYLVCGTDNLAEIHTGYFTKYGDGACDVQVISNLLKSEVFELARYLEIPSEILQKAPSAGLWEDQTDEIELGVTYDEIDRHIIGKEISKISSERIDYLHKVTMHKRQMPIRFNKEKQNG